MGDARGNGRDLVRAVSAIGHYVAFLVAMRSPDLAPYAMGVSNLLFTVIAAVRWRTHAPRSPLSMS